MIRAPQPRLTGDRAARCAGLKLRVERGGTVGGTGPGCCVYTRQEAPRLPSFSLEPDTLSVRRLSVFAGVLSYINAFCDLLGLLKLQKCAVLFYF